nr:hypothetical protein CFP56_44349 [Quercus suber]
MERAVSRAELQSTSSTPPSSPETITVKKVKTSQEFVYVDYQAPELHVPITEDEDLDYLLFAPNSSSKQTTQKITIRTPTPQYAEPGFVNPSRPHGFYFTSGTNSEQFEQAAVTGNQILSQSKAPWLGSSYAWKVVHLPHAAVTKAARRNDGTSSPAKTDSESKCRRKGKKGRIIDRRRHEVERQRRGTAPRQAQASGRVARESQSLQPMSEAARLEKSARNREKKLKRRAREKKKKAEVQGVPATTSSHLPSP